MREPRVPDLRCWPVVAKRRSNFFVRKGASEASHHAYFDPKPVEQPVLDHKRLRAVEVALCDTLHDMVTDAALRSPAPP